MKSISGGGHKFVSKSVVTLFALALIVGGSIFSPAQASSGDAKIFDADSGQDFNGTDPHVPCVTLGIHFSNFVPGVDVDWDIAIHSPAGEPALDEGTVTPAANGTATATDIDLESGLIAGGYTASSQGFHVDMSATQVGGSTKSKTFYVQCQPGTLTVFKDIDGVDAVNTFGFSDLNADAVTTNFSLGDLGTRQFEKLGVHTVTETVPSGWQPPVITCTVGSSDTPAVTDPTVTTPAVKVTVPVDHAITCRFFNTQTAAAPQCNDTTDNDADGENNFPDDPGCTSLTDNTESPNPQCSDGVDNDNDVVVDNDDWNTAHPPDPDVDADPGCDTDTDDSENTDNPECNNQIDDDGDSDGIDFGTGAGYDPDCDSLDDSETPECSDGLDNDGDTFADFPFDPGCLDADDDDELGTTQCDNGIDDDGDHAVDYPDDTGCTDPLDNTERSGGGGGGGGGGPKPTPTPTPVATPTPEPTVSAPAALPARPINCAQTARQLGLRLVKGTNRRDVMRGTRRSEVFCAKDGNDKIMGRGGNDIVWAGRGNDKVHGGKGSDRIRGQRGNDTIWAERGNDEVTAGRGKDSVEGNGGADRLFGQQRADKLVGGNGNDEIHGGPGPDACAGGLGTNIVGGCENGTNTGPREI